VAARLDDREVLSQLPVLSNTYLPIYLFVCYTSYVCLLYELCLLTFGQNINKLKLNLFIVQVFNRS